MLSELPNLASSHQWTKETNSFFLFLFQRNHSHGFEATASAIREIWSGSCRLACRQSEYSSFSGLSGLDRRAAASNCFLTNQTQPGRSDCICETCPCKLIDNVLRYAFMWDDSGNCVIWTVELQRRTPDGSVLDWLYWLSLQTFPCSLIDIVLRSLIINLQTMIGETSRGN